MCYIMILQLSIFCTKYLFSTFTVWVICRRGKFSCLFELQGDQSRNTESREWLSKFGSKLADTPLIVIVSPRILLPFYVGNILGIIRGFRRLLQTFKKLRRAGLINEFISISPNHAHRCIYISSDAGRVCRWCILLIWQMLDVLKKCTSIIYEWKMFYYKCM